MEQNKNLPVISKKLWHIVRVIYFMLRKNISKTKPMVDFNIMLKRGKIAGKAIGNLLTFHNRGNISPAEGGAGHFSPVNSGDYEFSCSNTPNNSNFVTSLIKRRHGGGGLFGACAHAPPTQEEDAATMNAVKVVLEMLNNNNNNDSEGYKGSYSPVLPGFGFGRTPVRQLRITDSPYPVRDGGDNGYVDKAAEAFIDKFYKDLKKQKKSNLHGL